MDEAQELLRRRIREVLVPGGSPIGEPGRLGRRRRPDIREVQGDLEGARQFFARLEEMGEVVNKPSFDGRLFRLGNEGTVGLRSVSKRGGPPTIGVTLNCVPEIRKIKFV